MKIIRSIDSLSGLFPNGSALTLGNFDGIHLGHQTLLQKTVEQSKILHIPSVVVTYYPNPSVVLGKRPNFKYLTLEETKEHLISSFNIDYLLVLEFTEELSRMSAEDFLEKIIIQKLNAKYIVIGYNHFFGANRRGDIHLLEANTQKFGYTVELKDAVLNGDKKISSSEIRKYLEIGDVTSANLLLGRPFFLEGIVKEGDKRGRTIGYPTANLEIHKDVLLPAIGVYASYTIVDGNKYISMTNVGKNPTFDGHSMHIETNIFDFSEEIYNKKIQVQLLHKIRDEVKFAGIEELKKQLAKDKEETLMYLKKFD
ncbi:MAG: bifunctional riboflavin kinase/FAD synthetase [Leptospira sp.]|nr:bifunctional riboflavin kinase/FAD synthetase [Leptospira sp.]